MSSLSELNKTPSRYTGPKFDSHIHLRHLKDARRIINISQSFNIEKMLVIIWEEEKTNIEKHFPENFVFAKYFHRDALFKYAQKDFLAELDDLYARGYKIIKFWFGPRRVTSWQKKLRVDARSLRINEPHLEPFFSHLEDLGLVALFHISDPDLWYKLKYQPPSIYGTKDEHLQEFETFIAKHSNLKIIGAHFGGQPEHLDKLGEWFSKYPNFSVDLGSARWMVREFAEQPNQAAKFIQRFQNRILFGTDINAVYTYKNRYFSDRYLSYKILLETNKSCPLPFPDPENNNQTMIVGLNLPLSVLKNIYWINILKIIM
ncbi:MAG: amidohydrolase family protein [Candidatus Hodarchaeota archaeon]